MGASRHRGTAGGEILHNLLRAEFTGTLYVVNPSATEVQGVPSYPSVTELPEPVDLVVVVVPAPLVLDIARQCAARGVGAMLVITAGFAEESDDGRERQRELLHICRSSGMRLVGPNCMGIVNTDPAVRLDATFSPTPARSGTVALVSQSGGLGVAAMALADQLSMGLSVFVSIGNRADVSPNDVLEFVEDDEGTDVVLLYVESFGNPRKFGRIARRVSAGTPIVAVKGGRSAAGALATASHTGALVAASDATVGALFHQAGIIRADTLEELLDLGMILSHFPVLAGPRVAIAGNAGGLGVLAVDACEGAGLEAPALSEELRGRLETIRPGAATRNPVDLLATVTGSELEEVLRAICGSGEVDAVLAVCVSPTAGGSNEITDRVLALATESPAGIPVIPIFVGGGVDGQGAPVFGSPERVVRALGRVWRYRQWRDADHGYVPDFDDIEDLDVAAAHELIAAGLADGGGWLGAEQVEELLALYGVPIIDTSVVDTPEAVGRAAAAAGRQVAIKASGPTLVHKTDAGAVLLGVEPADAQAQAQSMVERLTEAGHEVTGLIVQAMADPGVELIVGVVHDATFGPVVACGAGGVLTELLKDVALRLTPVTSVDAPEMLRELRTYPLLTGYRGSDPVDLDALEEVLLRIGRMADDHPEIAELDCNPVVASPQGAVVLDARVRVELPPRPPD